MLSMYVNGIVSHNVRNVCLRSIWTSSRLCHSSEDAVVIESREITKDRTQQVPVETSIKYLNSPAYKQTYGEQAVWVPYRRNFKGHYPPLKTRKTCIRNGVIATGSPCPICRDEYLVIHETNVKLLEQFVSPQTGSTLSYSKTGVCLKQHKRLLVAIECAKDSGLITFDVPFRKYDYSEYYNPKE